MKKNYLPIVGAVCVSLGMLMATGVDYNLWQGFYALVLMGAGCVCFNVHDRMDRAKSARREDMKRDMATAA